MLNMPQSVGTTPRRGKEAPPPPPVLESKPFVIHQRSWLSCGVLEVWSFPTSIAQIYAIQEIVWVAVARGQHAVTSPPR